jgi:thiamine-phosphate pyrophosphorylase
MARTLNRRAGRPALPPLLFFTDPKRTPTLAGAIMRLPPGSAVIYRHFGASDRLAVARALRTLCRRRRVLLLIGADVGLAGRVGADGVHLPERMGGRAAAARGLHRSWVITVAAHKRARPVSGADALVLAPVLPSASPSALRPLGLRAANAIASRAGAPVYALGGVSTKTAARLRGFAGLAAVEGLA